MAHHYDRYGDGVLVTGGKREVLISATDGKKVLKCVIFSLDTARKVAVDILQQVQEADGDA